MATTIELGLDGLIAAPAFVHRPKGIRRVRG